MIGGGAGSGPPPNTKTITKGQGATGTPGPSAVSASARPGLPAEKGLVGTGTASAPVPRYVPPTISDYNEWYRKQPDVSEAQLAKDIGYLRAQKKYVDIQKALTAYLTYHSKHAAPWMYEELALVMEINGRKDPTAIKTATGWAAHLARKTKDPVVLIAACDQLLLRNYDRIDLPGNPPPPPVKTDEMLALAMDAAPHRPEPIVMAMRYAELRADGKRMGDAAEHLLSLGWPDVDEAWRLEAHRRAVALAKILKAEGKDADANQLLERLPTIEARDVVVRLTWEGEARLELVVGEPFGATADHFNFRTVFGGTLVKEGRSRDKEAVYSCPRAFDGTYTVQAKVLFNDEKKPITTASVEIVTHEGTPEEKKEVTTLVLGKSVTFELKNGRRKQVLPMETLPRRLPERHFEEGETKGAAAEPKPSAKAPAGAQPKPDAPRPKG